MAPSEEAISIWRRSGRIDSWATETRKQRFGMGNDEFLSGLATHRPRQWLQKGFALIRCITDGGSFMDFRHRHKARGFIGFGFFPLFTKSTAAIPWL